MEKSRLGFIILLLFVFSCNKYIEKDNILAEILHINGEYLHGEPIWKVLSDYEEKYEEKIEYVESEDWTKSFDEKEKVIIRTPIEITEKVKIDTSNIIGIRFNFYNQEIISEFKLNRTEVLALADSWKINVNVSIVNTISSKGSNGKVELKIFYNGRIVENREISINLFRILYEIAHE